MKKYYIFNIPFLSGRYHSIVKQFKKGGLMVVPSGPGLATIGTDLTYTKAVQNSDFALPDSGYMVLLVRIIKSIKIKKNSGYKFLKTFLENEKFTIKDLFFINPSLKESELNRKYLNSIGVPLDENYQYVSPIYNRDDISDIKLINILNGLKKRPKYIIINLGSGVQEPLGYYLKQKLKYKPGILCSGAAIAFLTGAQATISPLIDKIGLGWVWRSIWYPKIFIPRYFKAFKLFFLILKSEITLSK